MFTTIFNLVVDSVVHHWESLMAEGTGCDNRYGSSGEKAVQLEIRMIRARNDVRWWTEEGNMRLKVQEAFLYSDDRMVASTDPGWIHTTFDMLTGLFDRAGLKVNVCKKVGMVCYICRVVRVQADKAYTCQVAGLVGSYKERQR